MKAGGDSVSIAMILSGSGLGATLSGALEGLGVPWPGAIVLTAAGANYEGTQGALLLGTLFAITYTAGAIAQYAVGRWCRGFIERWLSVAMRERLERAITKYGQAAVLWTRPLGVGNYISIPAGMMRMNPIRFTLYTFIGIWPWAFGMSLVGEVVSRYVAEAFPFVVALLVLVALLPVARKLWLRVRGTGGVA